MNKGRFGYLIAPGCGSLGPYSSTIDPMAVMDEIVEECTHRLARFGRVTTFLTVEFPTVFRVKTQKDGIDFLCKANGAN